VAGEVLHHVLLHELNTEIRVVHALDLVANTTDCKKVIISEMKELPKQKHPLSLFAFLELSTNSLGVRPVSRAFENMEAASSRAPPNRLPMVRRPEASDEIKSLPAREATMVFIALFNAMLAGICQRRIRKLHTQRQRGRDQR